jgi:hypothetical protein
MYESGQTRKSARLNGMSVLPPTADVVGPPRHFRVVPCVDGSGLARTFFTPQAWSVLPCVRPSSAVHMTAGHNALRGSGPGQKPAFDNAMAQVGCPDRRIDRLCITCCSPSQPSHHAGCPARSRLPRKCRGLFVTLALGHHGPGHPRNLVGKRDGGDLGGATA